VCCVDSDTRGPVGSISMSGMGTWRRDPGLLCGLEFRGWECEKYFDCRGFEEGVHYQSSGRVGR